MEIENDIQDCNSYYKPNKFDESAIALLQNRVMGQLREDLGSIYRVLVNNKGNLNKTLKRLEYINTQLYGSNGRLKNKSRDIEELNIFDLKLDSHRGLLTTITDETCTIQLQHLVNNKNEASATNATFSVETSSGVGQKAFEEVMFLVAEKIRLGLLQISQTYNGLMLANTGSVIIEESVLLNFLLENPASRPQSQPQAKNVELGVEMDTNGDTNPSTIPLPQTQRQTQTERCIDLLIDTMRVVCIFYPNIISNIWYVSNPSHYQSLDKKKYRKLYIGGSLCNINFTPVSPLLFSSTGSSTKYNTHTYSKINTTHGTRTMNSNGDDNNTCIPITHLAYAVVSQRPQIVSVQQKLNFTSSNSIVNNRSLIPANQPPNHYSNYGYNYEYDNDHKNNNNAKNDYHNFGRLQSPLISLKFIYSLFTNNISDGNIQYTKHNLTKFVNSLKSMSFTFRKRFISILKNISLIFFNLDTYRLIASTLSQYLLKLTIQIYYNQKILLMSPIFQFFKLYHFSRPSDLASLVISWATAVLLLDCQLKGLFFRPLNAVKF
ncbi:hypothetical protein AX774_g1875 [Zancudomyces culisetae]|uniref:Uncharacterized protein n=1 Tax=Zancudomyces culisetae TaxID=1213189 RepID=A0A1R1PUH6_ZANCU|nr:hypothetical protein AX774_g1875 [Zancudomyces culisetae]|eukprot:OMH84593.1 hypothetical protein AX774_g1875 [Zancudomyces culisetae]